MAEERDELLAHVATLYYLQDKSQQDIANQLELSRSNVSRLLKEARETGIVEIFVRHPLRRVPHLERQLIEQFGLSAAGVVESSPDDNETVARMGRLAARFLDAALEQASVLGISWGTAITATAEAYAPRRRHDVEVVQLMGGVGTTDPSIDGPALVQRFARRLTERYRYLHAPLVVDSPETARSLLAQRNIAETLACGRTADVALVGIGALLPGVSSLLRAGYIGADDYAELVAHGAVGDICARHFDRDGLQVLQRLNERLIAITLAELSAVPVVIGVAGTPSKAEALHGALSGRYINQLVTDSRAAEAVLALRAAPRVEEQRTRP